MPGRYSRKPASEIEAMLEAYSQYDDAPREPTDADTAVESPKAMEAPGPHKRSGEYLRSEFRKLLEEERRKAK
jgi:hypothetical protein